MHPRFSPFALAGLALSLGSAPLFGQQVLAQIQPGLRVRILTPGHQAHPARYDIGNLLRYGADTVVLTIGGGMARPETLTVALALGSRLEVFAGARSRYEMGAVIGGIVGRLAGAGIAFAALRCPPTRLCVVPLSQAEAARLGLTPLPAGRLGLGASLSF